MPYASHEPARPLGEYVSRFWDSTYEPSHPRVRILPRGTVELIVNLSEDEIRLYDIGDPKRCLRFPGIVLSGTYAGALDIDPMRKASMMGVHFKPGGAFPFFGGAIGELTNNHVPLDALWGRAAGELRERLCAAPAPQKRFHILDQTLRAQLGRGSEHPAVSLALDVFGAAGIGDTVRAVTERAGLSQRKFMQLFREQVGLTPKLFCRVRRFQYAREAVDRGTSPNWAQLALSCGYYDQSHLIHDFQEFSGLSPAGYLSQRDNPLPREHVPLF